jgi:hypothetical protein
MHQRTRHGPARLLYSGSLSGPSRRRPNSQRGAADKAEMDRGVIVGGGLIAASFLVAVLLNRSAREENALPEAVRSPPAPVCEDPSPRTPGPETIGVADRTREECKRLLAEPPKR